MIKTTAAASGDEPGQHGASDALMAAWRRHDWRENLFAPGVEIIQALTGSGATASGADFTPGGALDRCLGETAEILALEAAGGAAALNFDARRDGLAAGTTDAMARAAAMQEAVERRAVALWWQGALPAVPLDRGWLDAAGLTAMCDSARAGAAQRRATDWWRIDTGEAGAQLPHVVVCRTTSRGGQAPVLGYGCAPALDRAAAKALREVLLMELNLMELMAARATGHSAGCGPVAKALDGFARRAPGLLPASAEAGAETGPLADRPRLDPGMLAVWFGAGLALGPLTHRNAPLKVWLCRPELPPPDPPAALGSPFL